MLITPNLTEQKACSDEVMAWLHVAWEQSNAGTPIEPDPFYARTPLLTPAVVKGVLSSIEAIMLVEFQKYPGYHYPHQGVDPTQVTLIPPGFDKLPYDEQLGIVQGIDKIMLRYKAEPTVSQPQPDPGFVDYSSSC